MRWMLLALACLALAACGDSSTGSTREARATAPPEPVVAKDCESKPEKGQATREAAVEAYLSAVERGCVEELAALYTPHNFVPDEGKNGHRSTRDALRDMVNARCGLRLEHREINWGPKEPYGLDATIEYYDAHFSAEVEPSPGPFSRFRDGAHVDHVKTKSGSRWFVDPHMPFDAAEVTAVPGEKKCFTVELMGRMDAVIEARERAGMTASAARAAQDGVDGLPVTKSFRAVVSSEIDQRASDDGDLGVFVAAQPLIVRPEGNGRLLVRAQVLTGTEYDDHTWGGGYSWYEAAFVKESGEWVIDSMAEEGDGNRRIEWTADEA